MTELTGLRRLNTAMDFTYLISIIMLILSFGYVIYAHMNDQSVLDPCIDFRAQLSTYYQYLQTKEALLVNEIKLLTGNSS